MRKDLQLFALVIIALGVICIALSIFAIYGPKQLPFTYGHPGDQNAGISTHLTGENGTILPYGGPVLAQNGTFTGNFSIQAYYPTLVMVLVDGKATPFYYNGSVNRTHLVDMGVNTSMYVPSGPAFKITGLSEGAHDVALVTFVDPYNFNDNIWEQGGPVAGSAQNYAVIAANDMDAMYEIQSQTFAHASLSSTTSNSNYSFISKSFLSPQVWAKEKVKDGTVVTYYVNIGQYYINGNSTSMPFRLIQLLDYEQIPIRYDSTELVYEGRTTDSEPISVPLSFKAPKTTGPHKLIVLLALNQYQAMDPTHADPRWEITTPVAYHVDIDVF